ncbi:hypothetical protein BpJC7_06420 [Weizmannia acidilactici]|uniref:HTH luxR-type domain-containing protein n=1 Tax=Weizmannia acidilactici TaxID=2607726 RepID=A0A5J4JDH0_9BACI|nr:hypothetical protein BpJC4_09870 [Weizmannia acidilactici]GER69339.1 hypothetical protein BpJC7_06420 [Weizmannia acidilactici]GER72334.1 hypothetical protein BpPP18_04010 [Weizmannia acidilactici]
MLYLVLERCNNQEVGDYLNISVNTVKNHIPNIYRKSDRVQAIAKVYRTKYGQVAIKTAGVCQQHDPRRFFCFDGI